LKSPENIGSENSNIELVLPPPCDKDEVILENVIQQEIACEAS